MKSERKEALLAIKENIEMKLFSSEERCTVIQTQEEKKDNTFDQRHREHPLVADSEEEPESELQAQPKQQQQQRQLKLRPRKPPLARSAAKPCRLLPAIREEVEIEMELVPPIRTYQSKPVESSNKVTHLKWKRRTSPKAALVVRDVVCLPRGHYLAQADRYTVKERSPPGAKGITARITIDSSWTASQMHSRLVLLFRGWFAKGGRGQRFSFTYLQCTQGSRVLFAPVTPPEGWTGKHVLRISEHSALYILSHHEYLQAQPERSMRMSTLMRKPYLETSVVSSANEKEETGRLEEPQVLSTTDKARLNLDTIMSHIRWKNQDQKAKTHVHVRRKELLHGTLKAMRGPDFSFRKTPVILFTGDDTEDDREEPIKEFFRLALQELQKSPVFEGPPGRVFFTYDLTALEQRKYFEAGVLIGWSMAQSGPGPRFLHPALYQLMCGLNPSLEDFSWTDIPDSDTRLRLQKLQSCADVKQLPAALRAWMSSSGIPGISSGYSGGIQSMYCQMVKHYIYHRVASMISQFKEGLNSCGGLWDTVQSHWRMFLPLMTHTQQKPQTLEEFRQLFTACFSHPDQRLREEEEATAQQWDAILTLVRDHKADFSFEDLLTFITGAEHLHPLGLSSQIYLRFYSQDKSVSKVRLPYSSPSALELFLPRGVRSAAELSKLLSKAVHDAQGQTH
ncbi:uncharacterized protein LOC142900652 isoform X2 [Nelusetta ayraudi]|uniref:uncharacterized protein LOC142900652 isoform X2 n=1 Tax=Nelusetta ayraudi TaxID=303726 RepID=UPI003F6F79D8